MTSIRAAVVLASIVGALAVGAGASWGGPRLAGVLAISVVPIMWGVLHLVERIVGDDIWHFGAPYPQFEPEPSRPAGHVRVKLTQQENPTSPLVRRPSFRLSGTLHFEMADGSRPPRLERTHNRKSLRC